MTRHIDPREGPNPIHCFSSHFFTTLVDEGVDSVTKWTAKKGINVFEKKFVFIPINETLHWSLCVVVNPGHINDRADEDPMACLLFLDSLKAHKKKKVARKVREWLNSEWKRIKSEEKVVGKGPFGGRDEEGQDACPLLDPRSKLLCFFPEINFRSCTFPSSHIILPPLEQSHTRTTAGTAACLSADMLMRCFVYGTSPSLVVIAGLGIVWGIVMCLSSTWLTLLSYGTKSGL